MRVKRRAEVRFERRRTDYYQVLQEGTPTVVGRSEPRPPDLRKSVDAAWTDGDSNWEGADAVLSEVWAKDASLWRHRLKPFLQRLSRPAQTAFAELVKAGCQPDALAFQFHEATRVRDYEIDQERLRGDLDELEKLGGQSVDVVARLATRRRQFDEYLLSRRLRAIEGEPGDAELKILAMDLKDLVERHTVDYAHLRRRLDGRRQSLLGHAEVRLSRRVHEATGGYHDRKVEKILEDIRHSIGQGGRADGALKKRRQRWERRLDGRSAGAKK